MAINHKKIINFCTKPYKTIEHTEAFLDKNFNHKVIRNVSKYP